MTGSYVPGPLGKDGRHPLADSGTLVRTRSSAPDDELQIETNTAKVERGQPSHISRPARSNERANPNDWFFISVSFIVLQPVAVDYENQLVVANEIFARANAKISFHCVDSLIIPEQMSRRRAVNLTLDWGGYNAEAPMNAIAYSQDVQSLTGRIKIFVVRSTGSLAAFSLSRAYRSSLGERVYLSDRAGYGTLAHEFGHILMNHTPTQPDSDIHNSEANNLMHDGIGRTGENLNLKQIQIMRENARLTTGTRLGW